MEHWWSANWKTKTEILGENPSLVPLYHKSHIYVPGTEPWRQLTCLCHSNASIKTHYTACRYGPKQEVETQHLAQTIHIKFHRNPHGFRDWNMWTSEQARASHYEIARCSESIPSLSQSSHVKEISFCAVMLFWAQVWTWYGDSNFICSLIVFSFFASSSCL
jgi:hypothetical protein